MQIAKPGISKLIISAVVTVALAFSMSFGMVATADALPLTTMAVKITTPARATISKASSGAAGRATVKVGKAKNAKGYQYVVSQSKKFKESTTKKAKTMKKSYTFKNLVQGKKYYVKVRAYNKEGKTTKWGKWSAVKSVTVKRAASSAPSTPSTPANPTSPSTPSTAVEEPLQLQLFVMDGSPIANVADIESLKSVFIAVWDDQGKAVASILKNSGLSGNNVTMMSYGNVTDIAAAMQSGQADVIAVMDACPLALIEHYSDFRAIGFSSEQVQSITAADSSCSSYTIEANTYRGQSESLLTVTGKAVKPTDADYTGSNRRGLDVF